MQRWEGKATESVAYTFISLVQVVIVLYPVAGLEIPMGNSTQSCYGNQNASAKSYLQRPFRIIAFNKSNYVLLHSMAGHPNQISILKGPSISCTKWIWIQESVDGDHITKVYFMYGVFVLHAGLLFTLTLTTVKLSGFCNIRTK